MITFKQIGLEDCIFLNEVRNECAKDFLHDSSIYSIENTYNWFNNLKIPYYIVYNYDIKIGYFRLSNYSSINKNIYIGMDLHKDFRGKGFGYESYIKFIPFLIQKYNLNKISLEVLSTNIRAFNLYKKLGFVQEGIKRQDIFKNDEYIDSIIMSILKIEVENSKIYII